MEIQNGIPKDENGVGHGGIRKVYLCPLADFTGLEIDPETGMATFTTEAGVWKEYVVNREGSSFVETVTTSQAAMTTFTDQALTLLFSRQSKEKRLEIKVLAKKEQVAIIQDANKGYYLAGAENGMLLSTGTNTTGANYEEGNSLTVTLNAKEPETSHPIDATIFDAVAGGLAVPAL